MSRRSILMITGLVAALIVAVAAAAVIVDRSPDSERRGTSIAATSTTGTASPYDLTEMPGGTALDVVSGASFLSLLLPNADGTLTSYGVDAGRPAAQALIAAVLRAGELDPAGPATAPGTGLVPTLTFVFPTRETLTFVLDLTQGTLSREGRTWCPKGDLRALVQAATASPSTSTNSRVSTSSSTTSTTPAPPTPTSVVSSTTTSTAPAPRPVDAFDTGRAMAHVRALADDIGVRRGGTEAEERAARYALDHLRGLGYQARLVEVPIPNGLTSQNVIAVKQGASPLRVLIGAHIDSKPPSPGGNDNASGVAAVLELARAVADADLVPTVVFVLFGNEEMIDSDPDHHHYGSRAYVAGMTPAQQATLAAMISLDMVGYGDVFHVRTMGKGPRTLSDALQTRADSMGIDLSYLRDSSESGFSDHEPFELAGYPAAWLQWRADPLYHTAGDTASHVDPQRIESAGRLVLEFLTGLTESDLEKLALSRS